MRYHWVVCLLLNFNQVNGRWNEIHFQSDFGATLERFQSGFSSRSGAALEQSRAVLMTFQSDLRAVLRSFQVI